MSTQTYALKNEPIDVVIPSIEKDYKTLDLCIAGIKKYGQNIRRIIVVSDKKLTDKAEWFDERKFPFSKADLAEHLYSFTKEEAEEYVTQRKSRVGWYFQQLLKLYAPFVIPNISSNVLVLDSDTVFLRKVSFLNRNNGGLYNIGTEYHEPYFEHADLLTKGLVKRLDKEVSGITHHMLFQKAVLEDLFQRVEKIHNKEFWKAYCACVDTNNFAGAAEYEIYFNFVLSQTDQVSIRKLKWKNVTSLKSIAKAKKHKYHFVSCHTWMRLE